METCRARPAGSSASRGSPSSHTVTPSPPRSTPCWRGLATSVATLEGSAASRGATPALPGTHNAGSTVTSPCVVSTSNSAHHNGICSGRCIQARTHTFFLRERLLFNAFPTFFIYETPGHDASVDVVDMHVYNHVHALEMFFYYFAELCVPYAGGFCSGLEGYGSGEEVYLNRKVWEEENPDVEAWMADRFNSLGGLELFPGCANAVKQLLCFTALPLCNENDHGKSRNYSLVIQLRKDYRYMYIHVYVA